MDVKSPHGSIFFRFLLHAASIHRSRQVNSLIYRDNPHFFRLLRARSLALSNSWSNVNTLTLPRLRAASTATSSEPRAESFIFAKGQHDQLYTIPRLIHDELLPCRSCSSQSSPNGFCASDCPQRLRRCSFRQDQTFFGSAAPGTPV